MNIGNKIKNYRENKKMTQKEIAEILGVEPATVSKYESNTIEPSIENLKKLAEIFEMSVDELMQIKTGTKQEEKKGVSEMIELICKAVSLAMGVGVVVLSALGELDMQTGFGMLGIGLTCVALCLLQKKACE